VYRITCLPTGKSYVGSAAKSFAKRFAQHRHELNKGAHRSTYLQRSWEKYGAEAFHFEILETCEPHDAVAREQHWLDTLTPAFNTARVAGSTLGSKRTPEQLARISASRIGIKRTPEQRAHMRAIRGTPEYRQRVSEWIKRGHAEGRYVHSHAKRVAKRSKRHLVHGESLTLVELAQKYGRTVKSLQRRVERGARGDAIVALPYAKV
jgi:group I intron endonuclease